ncbi:NADH-quinone oxidoreductase subunit A [Cumulibacter manganitolerans]|uniref:NADH-quinone oxidoreductase subunit A n=1 Tax=Cumulibacter manganitolerans TaxID=1884992 RepID=UPI00129697CA|nr:NADH-quinone oxidoreductase subunit A [Cumulibacter manganitolerans]
MYVGLAAMMLLAVLTVVGMWLLGRATAVSADPIDVLPFQSGWRPAEHALSRFHARWYVATLVFLAFDVEMLFMYPWAVVVRTMGIESVVEMFVFLGVLLVAVFWARREGAFRWA